MHRRELTHGQIVYYAPPSMIKNNLENPDTANWKVDHPEKRYRRHVSYSSVFENTQGKLVRITRENRTEHVLCSRIVGPYDEIRPIRIAAIAETLAATAERNRVRNDQVATRAALIKDMAARQIIARPDSYDPTVVIVPVDQLRDLLWRTA